MTPPMKLPVRVVDGEGVGDTFLDDANSSPIAKVYGPTRAAYLAHAANRYPSLVGALREIADTPYQCPCCEGAGEHLPECTFAEDSPKDNDELMAKWEPCLVARAALRAAGEQV